MIHEIATFPAADGARLSARWDAPERHGDAGVLLLPGYWRRADSPRLRELALHLARRFPTLTLDFRGHGRSSGLFTFGRAEHLDVEAALAELARRGVRRAVLVGLSMGGAAAIVALGRAAKLPVASAGLLLIAAPSAFGGIRPRPWRGRRSVAWEDAWRVPRTDPRFPFSTKLAPEDLAGALPDMPVRLLHARGDWLVGHEHAERLLRAAPPRTELLLVDEYGLHADELLARLPSLVGRLVAPFVAGCLEPPAPDASEGSEMDAGPWLASLQALVHDASRASVDLGGVLPGGPVSDARAFATRDGVHLAFVAGGQLAWARGLRDGSTHGLNLLATQLVTDGIAWSPPLREALQAALRGPGAAEAVEAVEALRRCVVARRGDGGWEIRPAERPR